MSQSTLSWKTEDTEQDWLAHVKPAQDDDVQRIGWDEE